MSERMKENGWQDHGKGMYSVEIIPHKSTQREQILREWADRTGLVSKLETIFGTPDSAKTEGTSSATLDRT